MASYGIKGEQTWGCDRCSVEGSFDLHEGHCQHKGCNAEVCIGCSRSCSQCGGEFCPEHIVEIPVPERLHTAEPVCVTCHSKRQQQQQQLHAA